MNKVSSKLAASVRKVKDQDKKPEVANSAARQIEAEDVESKPKSSPVHKHPKRVWPD